MVVTVLSMNRFPVEPGTGGYVDLAADNGFDARRPGRAVKLDHAVHGAVVRDRHAVKPQLLRPGRQLLDLTGAVQKTVFRMNMQMCKCHPFPPNPRKMPS